jgi:uncharacterized protein
MIIPMTSTKTITLAALALLPALGFANSADAASFNCKAARNQCPEKSICQSTDLSSLDEQMTKLYDTVRAKSEGMGSRAAVRDDQKDWLAYRDACGCDQVCLVEAYTARNKELAPQAAATRAPETVSKYRQTQVGKLVLLGEHTVKVLKTDQDTVVVGRPGGFFTHINIKVKKNRVNFYDVKVIYGNDEVDHLQLRRTVEQGGETGDLQLDVAKYKQRVIKEIQLTYQSGKWWKGRALVEIYGRHG